jgi:hypothetical protein
MSLITNIAQVRSASTINISNTLTNFQPYIDEAELRFIKPYIGETFYDLLDEVVNGSGSSDYSKYDILLLRIRIPLALYAMWIGADEIAVSISAQGIQTIETPSHRPAMQYQIMNLKESWIARANTNMDLLLKYLENHKEDFPEYSPVDNDLFIHNATEFQKVIDIRESRRVFISLKPIITSIEKKYIRPTLGMEYFDELKEVLNSSGSSAISDDDQAVLDLIRPALAHLTLERALLEISIDVLDWGVFETSSNTFDKVQGKANANRDRIGVMVDACEKDGEAELKELQEYLDTNASASRYVTYYNSDRRITPGTAPEDRVKFVNDKEKGIFVA